MNSWDPLNPKRNLQEPTPQCLRRLNKERAEFIKDPPQGIFVSPDEADVTLVHALVCGPSNTPYENGFFYFLFRFPANYPWAPPWVRLMTTGGSQVRFNPNLYSNGKVCLSILGTWNGPEWTAAYTLSTILLSIQSLMSENPYFNEPGFKKERRPGDAATYNDIIRHETLRAAVIGMIDNDYCITMPQSLQDHMEKIFIERYDFYKTLAQSNSHLNHKSMMDPHGGNRGKYQYNALLRRLEKIYSRLKVTSAKRESFQVNVTANDAAVTPSTSYKIDEAITSDETKQSVSNNSFTSTSAKKQRRGSSLDKINTYEAVPSTSSKVPMLEEIVDLTWIPDSTFIPPKTPSKTDEVVFVDLTPSPTNSF